MTLKFYKLGKCFCLIIFLGFFKSTSAVTATSDSENGFPMLEDFLEAEFQTGDNFYFYMPVVYSDTVERALQRFIDAGPYLASAELVHAEESIESNNVLNAIELEPVFPSGFTQNTGPRGQLITDRGQRYDHFTLPTDGFNCSLFGIYGRRVQREEVVQQLLLRSQGTDALSLHVRALMAEDIFAAIILGETLPEELEWRRGQEFRTLAGIYLGAQDQASARQVILESLRQPGIFDDYVRYFIGGSVGQLYEQEVYYNMLTFTRTMGNEEVQGSALGAIAAMNSLSLRIFQEGQMGLLEEVYFYQNPNPHAHVVTLLYNGHNHFDLLVEASQGAYLPLSEEQVEKYAKKKFSDIFKANIDLESLKQIALKKLETLKIGMSIEITRRLFEAQFQKHLSNFERCHILTFADVKEAFYRILNQQAMVQLRNIDISKDFKRDECILKLESTDVDIQEFCEQWNKEFHEQYAYGNKLYLFTACEKGDHRIVQLIIATLKSKAEVNAVEKSSGVTSLMVAAHKGYLAVIIELIAAGANVDYSRLRDGVNALFMAAQNGHLEIVKELIKARAKVDHTTLEEATALFIAVQKGHLEIVRELINANANVDHIISKDGSTALFIAVKNRYLEIVKEFIKAKANVNYIRSKDRGTALYLAAQDGHLEIVKELIRANANVDHTTLDGSTALFIAAQNRHLEIVGELIAANAKVDLANSKGITALIKAVHKGYLEIVKKLIAANADVKYSPLEDGAAALIVAAQNGYLEIVKELIAAGADVNCESRNKVTPLLIAAQQGHLEIIRKLIAAGAYVSYAVPKYEATALYVAAQNGHLEIVKELIKAKANVNHATLEKATALMAASQNGYLEIVKELIAAGAHVDHITLKHEITALRVAVHKQRLEIVKELIAAGANVNQSFSHGTTFLLHAVSNKNYEIAKLLLEAGADMYAENSRKLSPFKLSFQKGKARLKNLFLEFKRKLEEKQAVLPQIMDKVPNEKQSENFLKKEETQEVLLSIKEPTAEYSFTKENQKAAEELKVDLEIDSESIKRSLYTEEWTEGMEKFFQERWNNDRDNKKLKKSKSSGSQAQDQVSRIPTNKLSGERLKLRQGLKTILVDQPKNVHKDVVKSVVEGLKGKVEENRGNRYRVYIKLEGQRKDKFKYIGSYEVKHDKDPKDHLTRKYLKRVAIILERAVKLGLIDQKLVDYFPEEWEMLDSQEEIGN